MLSPAFVLIGTLLDVFILYAASHAFLRKRMDYSIKYFVMCIVFTVLISISNLLFHQLDLTERSASTLAILIPQIFLFAFLKILYRLRWSEHVLLQLLLFVTSTIITLPLVMILIITGEVYLVVILSQLIALSLLLLFQEKLKLYKLYDLIKLKALPNVLVRQICLIVALIGLVAHFSVGGDIQRLNLSWIAYSFAASLIVLILLFPTILKLYRRQTKEAITNHDLYNDLLSTGIALENMEDVNEIRSKFKAHAERLGVELPNASVSEIQNKPVSQQIERFIKLKQMQRQSRVEIIPDVGYYNDHKTVDLQLLLQWLGTLLDNAIDASVAHRIYVRLMVTSSRLSLQVSNEYLGTDREDFEAWFTQGYSTKGEGRGLGLYHLNKTVTNLGGTIACFEEFNEVHRTSYLHLVIKFR